MARPRRLLAWLRARSTREAIESSLYGFILRNSARDQIILVVLTVASFPILYYSLELPKTIINHAIGGRHFPQTILGVAFDQVTYLLILCGVYLALVVTNGLFKFYINVRKGRLGERMLRNLRYDLYQRTLRFPLQQFSRSSGGQIITMMTAELEPVAGFIGDAFALPIFQGGTLLTILVFMFVQNPLLGAAAVALYPVQGYVIPKLQRKVRELGRLRIRKIRGLADRLAESIAARVDIRVNDDAPYQLAEISGRLEQIYEIRYESYYRKFFARFLSNFLTQLTPFFFYALGGYFVIVGDLSFGALVAVLAAYKDMSDPWKELLDFYQDQQDVAIKYEQVMQQFDVADMLDTRLLLERPAEIPRFAGDVVASGVTYRDPDGVYRLEGVSFSLPLATHVAVVGASNGGKAELAGLLARLATPTTGRIAIGGVDLASLPVGVVGCRIGYVGPATYLFGVSLRENLLVGLRHRPPAPDGAADKPGGAQQALDADWVDYAQAGVAGPEALRARMIDVIRLVDLEADVYELGLHGRLDPVLQPEAAARLLEARRRLAARLAEAGASRVVERWDPHRFNRNASLAENLLFGTPVGSAFADESLPRQPYLRRVIDEAGLTRDLLRVGAEAAATMIEVFGEVDTHLDLIEEFSLVRPDELPDFEALLNRIKDADPAALGAPDQERLLSLAFRIVPARHRFEELEDDLPARILEARDRFAAGLPAELRAAISFFDEEQYNAAASLYDNILFGKVAGSEPNSRATLHAIGAKIVDEMGLRDLIIATGLEHPVGTGGTSLSPAQRQKVAIARAVLKRPDLLVLNEATAGLDGTSQAKIMAALRREFEGRCLFWALHSAVLARSFDQVLVIGAGRLVESGAPETLAHPGSALSRLIEAG
ncbi:MAG TPA: ABC transporter ATP-binding protein [Alphaproteobacteria bacterium]|nr:ABC transporter ATP-binding protein [Alphaproteobacteria bacterium]